jgi:hypothetical protein
MNISEIIHCTLDERIRAIFIMHVTVNSVNLCQGNNEHEFFRFVSGVLSDNTYVAHLSSVNISNKPKTQRKSMVVIIQVTPDGHVGWNAEGS